MTRPSGWGSNRQASRCTRYELGVRRRCGTRGTSDYDAFAIQGRVRTGTDCKWQCDVYLLYIYDGRERARDDTVAKREWGEPPVAAGGAAGSRDLTNRISDALVFCPARGGARI